VERVKKLASDPTIVHGVVAIPPADGDGVRCSAPSISDSPLPLGCMAFMNGSRNRRPW